MMQRQFAVTRVNGNEESVLKLFGENEKTAAIAYCSKIAKENTSGIIACVQARFDAENQKMSGNCRIFEVW